jgi:hypothetical protein
MEETEKEKPWQFKSKDQLGGAVDPRINSKGNPDIAKYAGNRKNKPDGTKLTNRELREREFMSLLRKLKPHVADAIMSAVKIMKNQEANHANQLKAATILLQQYRDTMLEVYDKDYDEEVGEEVQQQNSPVFSLKIVNAD